MDDDYNDGYSTWTWGDPDAEGEVRHRMSDADGIVQCCGRTADQIGGDWQTADPARVNCLGKRVTQ